MTKHISALAVGLSAFLASACSTIYFENGSRSPRNLEYGEWHHDGVLRLVEFSDPVDMSQRCEGKPWSAIKIEETFVQGLAKAVSYGMYDPWDVSYSCRK